MSKLYIRLPTLGVLCQEDKPLEHLAWKTRGFSFRRAIGLEEIETPLLKGAHKSSHVPGPREEEIIWDEPGSALPADLGKASQGGRRQLEHTQGTQMQHPFWGACSTTKTLVLANIILESF